MKCAEAGRSEVSVRRGRRKKRAGRGAQPCTSTHRLISAVIWATWGGIGPLSWFSCKSLRRAA